MLSRSVMINKPFSYKKGLFMISDPEIITSTEYTKLVGFVIKVL